MWRQEMRALFTLADISGWTLIHWLTRQPPSHSPTPCLQQFSSSFPSLPSNLHTHFYTHKYKLRKEASTYCTHISSITTLISTFFLFSSPNSLPPTYTNTNAPTNRHIQYTPKDAQTHTNTQTLQCWKCMVAGCWEGGNHLWMIAPVER